MISRRLPRSYLYVPGDSGRRLALAHTRGADAVIADLEDAVTEASKARARDDVAAWLSSPVTNGAERWVRLNSGGQGLEDLDRVFGPGMRGICLPKVSSAADVEAAVGHLSQLAVRRSRAILEVAVMPLIESAAGLLNAPAVARVSGVLRLQLGEVDLAADLNLDPNQDEIELLTARASVVTASAAAGLLPPIGGVEPNVRDAVKLQHSSWRLRRLGFGGRAAVHPDQLSVIHGVFTPSPDEIAAARKVLAAYDAATARGDGAFVDDSGRMMDRATVRRSRRTIALTQEEANLR